MALIRTFSRETTLRPDILRATSATFSPRACTLEGVPVGTSMDGLLAGFQPQGGEKRTTVRTGCRTALQSTCTAGEGRSRPRSGAKRLVADRLVLTWALLGTPPGVLMRRPELARVTSSDAAAPHNFSRETTLRPDILRATSATFCPTNHPKGRWRGREVGPTSSGQCQPLSPPEPTPSRGSQ